MLKKLMIVLVLLIAVIFVVNVVFDNIVFTTFKNRVVPLDSFTGYPLASKYGLKKNSKGKANFNSDLFTAAIKEFGGLIIDGKYYLDRPSKLSISEVGIVGDAEFGSQLIFDLDSSKVLFNSSVLEELYISDVSIVNNGDSPLLIAYQSGDINVTVENVTIKNSSFEGNISAYRVGGDGNVDPNSSDVAIKNFVLQNNVIRDTVYSFIKLEDIPYDNVLIQDNEITNFKYVFANLALANSNDYNDELFSLRKSLIVKNNVVTSDDDWWADSQSDSYYTFILAEGDKVEYVDNHVEGLKTLESTWLYDAYLSCNEVIYTGNVSKNNVCLNPDKETSAFIKSKSSSVPAKRTYSNNTFIIEEAFASKFGASSDSLYVDFYSLETEAEYYEISNNTFEGYEIRFPSSSRHIKDFIFNNNTINTKKASGSIINVRVSDDYDLGIIEFTSNEINIEERAGEGLSDEDVTMLLFRIYNESTLPKEEKINLTQYNNNTISGPFDFIFYGARDEFFEINMDGDSGTFMIDESQEDITIMLDRLDNNYFLTSDYNRFEQSSSDDINGLIE